jgi:hypothetical protein
MQANHDLQDIAGRHIISCRPISVAKDHIIRQLQPQSLLLELYCPGLFRNLAAGYRVRRTRPQR